MRSNITALIGSICALIGGSVDAVHHGDVAGKSETVALKEIRVGRERPAIGSDFVAFTETNHVLVVTNHFSKEKRVSEKVVAVWNVKDGKEVWSSRMPAKTLGPKFSISPDGNTLVAVDNGKVRTWNSNSGKELFVDKCDKTTRPVVFAADGRQFATLSLDRIQFWSRAEKDTFARGATISANSKAFKGDNLAGDLSPDFKRIAALARPNDSAVRIWELSEKKEICTLPVNKDFISKVAYSRCGKWIVTRDSDRVVTIWDATNGNEIGKLDYPQTVTNFAISPDSRWLATGALSEKGKREVVVWALPTRKRLATALIADEFDYATTVAFSPDTKLLVAATNNGNWYVWEIAVTKLK